MIKLHTSTNNITYVNEKSISRFTDYYFPPRDRYEGTSIHFINGDDIVVEETPEEVMRLIRKEEDVGKEGVEG